MVSMTEGQKASLSPEAVEFLSHLRHPPLPSLLSGFLTMPSRIQSIRDTFSGKLEDGEEKLIKQHDLQVKEIEISGVPVVVIEQAEIQPHKKSKILFNVHGGGFTIGSPRDRCALTTAVELGVTTYSVRYTRSPEARYPVARDQCLSVYKELITRGPPNGNGPISPAEIYAQGSSSGGQILLSMMVKAHQDGTPLPTAGMYLCTPAADLTGAGDTMVSNASRDVLPTSFLWSMALHNYPPEGGIDDKDPQYSPIYYKGYDTKFPRTVITTGTRDIMLSSATRLYWVLREAGIEVELLIGEGMWHGFNWDPVMPEALQTRKAVLEFLEGWDCRNKTWIGSSVGIASR